jgi:glucosamine--fructose-6-phosphate aminotransferase (isomerizing)
MCGIVGYVGPDEALPIVLEGLRRLEYRGYDSAGVAMIDGGLGVVKRAGKLAELESALENGTALGGSVGMGHTRWATHGAPTDVNAHPHLDCDGRIAVIHNGIIENFQELRDRLEKQGHELRSDTDTECVAHLVEEMLGDGRSFPDAVRAAVRELEGAYSLVVCSLDDPDVLVGVKVSSPLIVGVGEGETMLASDIPAVLERTTTVIPLAEGMVVEIRRDGATFTDLDGTPVDPQPITVDWDVARAQKDGYDTFMRKEISPRRSATHSSAGRSATGWCSTSCM